MVQNVNNLQAMQAMQMANNGSNVSFCCKTKPYESDSYGGKTLLTLAGLGAAVIFRRKIAGTLKKIIPNLMEKFKATALGKDLKHIDGEITKYTQPKIDAVKNFFKPKEAKMVQPDLPGLWD